jgi:dTDP-4-amino-4,6-dideoxygalactose transaminase
MEVLMNAEPAYFGFTMYQEDRDKFSKYLEEHGIRTRPFFAGNITRHDPFKYLNQAEKLDVGDTTRVREFPVADRLMEHALFVGVWPGIKKKQLKYMAQRINNYDV